MNEPGAIPYFEAREAIFASLLEHSQGLLDRGLVGCVGHQLDGANVSMAHKIAAHDSLPSVNSGGSARGPLSVGF